MKIAINARFLLPDRLEGLGQYSLEVLRRLVALRPADEFVFLFDRPFDPRFLFEKNVSGRVLFPPARHPFLWWIWFEIAVFRALKNEKADVFFSPDQFLSLRSRVPTVLTCHDLLALEFPEQVPLGARLFYRHFFPKYLKKAARIAAISEATRAEILALGGIEKGKIEVAPNGCREGFEPLQLVDNERVRSKYADGQPYFFYAGAIQPRKNLARLIEAFSLFKSRKKGPEKLLIAGRLGWKTADVLAAREASFFKNDIVFLGFLPDSELQKLMSAALALAFVSVAEGFGLPILEAFWAEVPVLTSGRSAMAEVAGEAAVLVDPFSVESIAEGLEKLAVSPQFRADLIEKGRTRRTLFDFQKHAEIISRLIDEAAFAAEKKA